MALLLLVAGCGKHAGTAKTTRITIDSAPEHGASVMVEGVERGPTPVVIEGLEPGWVDVLLKKDRYRRAVDRVEVKTGSNDTFTIQMEPLVGYLTVESEPLGAEVRLSNGTVLGQTPIVHRAMPVGEYSYELKLPDHYPQQETLTIQEDFQYERRYILKPMEGSLSVLSQPTGALIRLNNHEQENKSPAKFSLPPGIYRVSVYSRGFVEAEETIDLKPNQEAMVNLKMAVGEVPPGMVLVPAGPFLFGEEGRAPDESPKREVTLEAFYIDKYEVTNEAFKKVFPDYDFPQAQEQFPVHGVSWERAGQFAQAVGKRLPTEQEWEKAARGEKGGEFPWGAEFSTAMCNTKETDVGGMVPVGKYLGGSSPYGCADMAGNAYEWVHNWYEAYPGNKLVTRDYGQIYRVLRGGSYNTDQFSARCARRHFDRMDAAREDYGFRCVKDIPK